MTRTAMAKQTRACRFPDCDRMIEPGALLAEDEHGRLVHAEHVRQAPHDGGYPHGEDPVTTGHAVIGGEAYAPQGYVPAQAHVLVQEENARLREQVRVLTEEKRQLVVLCEAIGARARGGEIPRFWEDSARG